MIGWMRASSGSAGWMADVFVLGAGSEGGTGGLSAPGLFVRSFAQRWRKGWGMKTLRTLKTGPIQDCMKVER